MSYSPNVSVIIPTWNRQDQLSKAILSVLKQTSEPFEIIVSDDGSTDDSYNVVQSFKNPKIKWLTANHLGLPAVVRNRAIKKSRGEWLAFLDSDDEWLPKKLEKQLALAKKTNHLAVCCNAYSVNSQGKQKKYLDYQKDTITFSDLIKINYVILSSAIIHRSLLRKCFGFPEGQKFRNAPDYALWLRVSTLTDFAYLDELLVNYFDEPEKSIRRFTQNPLLQKKIILENLLSWCKISDISYRYQAMVVKQYILTLLNLYKNRFLENKK